MSKKLILGIILLTGLQSTHPGIMDCIPAIPTTLSYQDKLALATIVMVGLIQGVELIDDIQQGKYRFDNKGRGTRKVNMDCLKFYKDANRKLMDIKIKRQKENLNLKVKK